LSSSLILATSFNVAGVLTLVLPVAVFIAIAVWYYMTWWQRGDEG
jgi:hypothetical protein